MDLKKLLGMMVSRKASDLIISAGFPPTLRVDGKLAPMQVPPLSAEECRETIFQCMTDSQKQQLEAHRDCDFSYGVPALGRFRVNVHCQRGTVAAAIRLVSASTPDLRSLGLPPVVMDLADSAKGLLLVTGPTGSGKSTTLAAIVQRINQTRCCHIITIEDPIEHVFSNDKCVIEQREVGADTPGFAHALRHVLRQDPDVIMIGEMRDRETADIAIEASLTGHLVLSTLHTNSAVETVTRLLDMGCDSFNFADAMLGVLAKRLCKRICEQCKEGYHPTRQEYDELVQGYGLQYWDRLGVEYTDDLILYRGWGCELCNKTGFKGRVPLHELLVGSEEIKNLIQSRARTAEILNVAMREGMVTLVQDGIQKVLRGLTTYRQVRAVAIK